MRLRATIAVLMGLLLAPSAFGQQAIEREKLAQTGMKFLSLSLDPRAAALGDAVTAREGSAMMLFYNPAGIASQTSFANLAAGQTQWIADIEYNQAALALKVGNLGVFGFSLVAVDYGTIEETIRADNDQGFIDVGLIKPTALSFGVAYARALTDRFSVGAHVKYANQDLGSSIIDFTSDGGFERSNNTVDVIAYDFGVLYKTGFKSLTFAFSARNFAPEVEYQEESFQLPLTMKIGVAMDVLDLMKAPMPMHNLVVSIDAENPRDFSEQVKMGAEYMFLNTIALRAGYILPTDQQGLNLGLGVQQTFGGVGFGADYAYTEFGIFSAVHRIALRLSF